MPVSVLHRNYNMTDPELCMFVSNLVGLMLRDATEFITRGIIAGDITDLQALGNAFEVFPDDGVLQSNVSIAVEDKESAREALMISAKEVYDRALNKWGDKSARYKSFGAFGIVSLSDLAFLFVARRVHKQGTLYLTELSDQGLTQTILDDLDNKAEAFEIALNAIKDAETVRDMKTEERIEKGNELYSFVSKYCEIGKQIWENVSEAKYNDYVIYRTPQELPGKVLNLTFDHLAAAFSWDASPHSETYRLVFRAQGSSDSWTAAYVGPNTSAPYSFDDGDWEIRCRGINSEGKGPWSDLLNITVGLPIPQNVTTYLGPSPDTLVYVNWDGPIPGASRVNVYKSIVPIGDPPGEYIVAGEWSQAPPYYETSTPGVRYYFYCTAYAHYYESPPSEVVFVDS